MKFTTKRINVRVLLVMLAIAVIVVVGVVVIHRVQVTRNAGGLARLARSKLVEGKTAEAAGLFARYLTYRPNDAEAQAEFARLLIERAARPDATKNERGYAYNAIETAVRKNPDDVFLRRQLADWMLRYGRFGDAAAELAVLREQVAAAPQQTSDAETVTPHDIELLQAWAFAGMGEYQDAAASAAAVVGFDLNAKAFSEVQSSTPDEANTSEEAKKKNSDVMLRASLTLASLLEDRLEDPKSAAAVLEHLAASNSQEFRAWLVLAQWHQSHGSLAKAAEAVRTAVKLAPDEPDVLFIDLELAVAEQRLAVAEQLATKAHSLFPEDERSYRGLATVAMQQRDPEKAIAFLKEGLAAQPGQPSLLLMLADVQFQDKRFAEMEETIRTFVTRYGAMSPAVGMLESRLMIAQKRWLPAKQKLESVRPLVAQSQQLTAQVDLLLGQCYEMLGQFDEQLAANQRVLSENHESVAARIGVAGALAASGKPDAALTEFEAVAASLPPDKLPASPQVWSPLLQLRIARQMKLPLGQRDWSSVDQLLDILEQSPFITDGQLSLLRSDVLVRKGDSAAALALLKKTVEANPSSPQPLAALALLTLREQGPAATSDLLAMAPAKLADDPLLLMVRAQLAARAPAEESARTLKNLEEKVLTLPAEESVRLLSAIAAIHRGLGERRQAERVWNAAIEKRPDDLGIRASLFELACEEGDVKKAEAAATEIARLSGPASPQGRVSTAAALVLGVRVQQAEKAAGIDRRADRPETLDLSDEQKEQLTAAKNLLIEAENDRPGWAQIQQLFAEIAGLQGDIPTAIERLQQATRLGPPNPSLIRQLVSLLYLSNRLEEAQQALALVGPDGLDGLEQISAEIDIRTGQFDNAVALAERSLGGARSNTAVDLLWFGQLLARAGKTDRAEEALQQAVDADPRKPSGWMALFSNQFAAGRRQSALQTMAGGEESLGPPERQMFMAQCLEMLGQIDDAERSFREAVAAAPDDQVASRSLADFLFRHGRLQAASEEMEAIIAADYDDPTTLRTKMWARRMLAEIKVQAGGYRDIERAVKLLDDNADRNGRLAAEDLALQSAILAARPDPSSWRRALDHLEKLASLQPLSNAQRTQKAKLLEQLGRWDECRNELVSIASAPNTPPAFHTILIETLLRHKELESAQIWLKTLSNRLPDSPVVWALQAKLSLAQNDRTAAVAAIRKLMPGDAPAPELANNLGPLADLLEELGFNAAADKVFTQLAASSTDGVIARTGFLGRAQRGDEALDLLEQSWEDIPLEKALRTAISVLDSLGDNATKLQSERVGLWFAKARRQDPDSPRLAMLFADFVSMTGDEEKVVGIYRELLARKDIAPQQAATVANNLAFHLAEPDSSAEALKLVDSALAELGPHPDVLDTRGVVLLAAGKGEESIAELKESLLVPSATKYLHLAQALASQQQLEAARTALAEAKKLGFSKRRLVSGDQQRLNTLEAALGQ